MSEDNNEDIGFWDTKEQEIHAHAYAKVRGLDLKDETIRDFIKKQMQSQGYCLGESLQSKKKKRKHYRYRIFEIFSLFFMCAILPFRTFDIMWLFILMVITSGVVAIFLFRDLYKTLVQLHTLKKNIKHHAD